MMSLNLLISILQLNFIFMSFTVEKAYCRAALDISDTTPLVQQTIEFCQKYNLLFLERPEWLVKATCVHADFFWILYSTICVTSLLDMWQNRLLSNCILLGIGGKIYAVLFYHYMEFTSHVPPSNLLAYFGAEGAYMLSIGLVLYKIFSSTTISKNETATTKKTS